MPLDAADRTDASPHQRAALAQAGEDGPTPAIDGVVRWRLVDLAQWVWDRFSVSISRQTLGRELRAMRYRKLSARPDRVPARGVAAALLSNVELPFRLPKLAS